MQVDAVGPFRLGEFADAGYAEHFLVWAWRRIATGSASCQLLVSQFDEAFGEEGPEVFVSFCNFLRALGTASRRRLIIGDPGKPALTPDERRILSLLAAIQFETPGLIEAHMRWICVLEPRETLPHRRSRAGDGTCRS